MTPAPSPDDPSPPHAPLCSMHERADRESDRIWWEGGLVGLVMKPTPHASRSWVRENELAGDGKSVWRGVGGERGEAIEEENICDFIF